MTQYGAFILETDPTLVEVADATQYCYILHRREMVSV